MLGRESAGDVDGWIEQAKKLQVDIEQAKETARDVVRRAEEGQAIHDRVEDASSKRRLLLAELAFNESLLENLQAIADLNHTLDTVQEAVDAQRLLPAIDLLHRCDAQLARLGGYDGSTAVSLLRQRAQDVPQAIGERLDGLWHSLVIINAPENTITLTRELDASSPIDAPAVLLALEKLHRLDDKIDALYQALESMVISPLLDHPSEQTVAQMSIRQTVLSLSDGRERRGLEQLFDDLHVVVNYLSKNLPPSIAVALSQSLMPSLSTRLVSLWLTPCVPSSLDGMPDFQGVLSMVCRFIDRVESLGWKGRDALDDWVQNTPRVWLTRRRENSLEQVRSMLGQGLRPTKMVDRIETQTVAPEHGMFVKGGEDDWNAHWSDHEDDATEATVPAPEHVDEDDVSAWGLDEDEEQDGKSKAKNANSEDGEDGMEEAWGWGDDTQDAASTPSSPRKAAEGAGKRKRHAQEASQVEREVTLRETYTITAVPSHVLAVVTQIVHDAEVLSDPE